MTLSQRRESAGRTRFLLALSLSTLTALGVAAPLALQAVNADESVLALDDPVAGARAHDDDLLASPGARSLSDESDGSIGGITQRPAVKGQGQTSKTESEPAAPVASPKTEAPPLTNPEPAPATDTPVVEPAEVSPPAPAPTTTSTAPPQTSETTVSTTVPGSSTTDTTDAVTTTSTTSTTTSSSSSSSSTSSTTSEPPSTPGQ